MTTIVYSDGILAFDSLSSYNNGKFHAHVTKAIKHDGKLIAACGETQCLPAFFDWVKAGAGLQDKIMFGLDQMPDVEGLVISKKGIFMYNTKLYPLKVDTKFYAMGSGMEYAYGALMMGATAVEAVKVAAKMDQSTGGKIKKLSLD